MIKHSIVVLFFLMTIYQINAQDTTPIVIGTTHTIKSDILKEDRQYWVSLPDGYTSKDALYKNYPVLVVLDGNIHFKAISGMVDYMSADVYRNRVIPEMIVVGIQNVDRRRDYTPDKINTVRENNTGGGDRFLAFLEDELIPQLNKQYRTSPYHILYGHSLGGLLATHTYMKEKTLFNAFLAIDPSFGTWDAETMDNKLSALTEQSFKRYIYIATANWGKRNIRNRDRHVRFYESLNSKCHEELPAKLEYFEKEDHTSVPLIAFHNGISVLFEGYGISYRDVKNKAQLTQHYKNISHRLSWDFSPPEYLVNQLGNTLLRSETNEDKNKALEYFVMNTTYYPKSPDAYTSLGEAYETLGDTARALECYKKVLDLNPDNEQANYKIKQLSKSK